LSYGVDRSANLARVSSDYDGGRKSRQVMKSWMQTSWVSLVQSDYNVLDTMDLLKAAFFINGLVRGGSDTSIFLKKMYNQLTQMKSTKFKKNENDEVFDIVRHSFYMIYFTVLKSIFTTHQYLNNDEFKYYSGKYAKEIEQGNALHLKKKNKIYISIPPHSSHPKGVLTGLIFGLKEQNLYLYTSTLLPSKRSVNRINLWSSTLPMPPLHPLHRCRPAGTEILPNFLRESLK
jgi:hypothetical protein